ncbi:MAG: phosphoribosylanthranilate isomerase [Brevundimonas sp.]|uniref:phosphoribosylanthranilate isomerase n=1 Tax=Brevundimonas sp. TaxID=1871086 RepID=UPI00121D479F|nr:phosphoribosylanthranilate isomerase [Brevundimonas sp.]RZJ17695.1 MAG: phosphoribosylanthranilate isomerase [Brevundimonas sp.]
MSTGVKICGLMTAHAMEVALDAGAAYVGLVMVKASPRYIGPHLARSLALQARGRAKTVLLFADTPRRERDLLVHDIEPDMIQLHGSESLLEIADVRVDYEVPVIKAVGVSGSDDLAQLDAIQAVADFLLLDAKQPRGSQRTGGHGASFDWSLLAGRQFDRPWFLAGGLTPDNVAEAVRITGAPLVDVSTGVESAPGVKDNGLIQSFLGAVSRS